MPPKKCKDAPAAETEGLGGTPAAKAKRAKKVAPEAVTERQSTPRAAVGPGAFKILSWNVDGIRAEGRLRDLAAIVSEEKPDLLCLQVGASIHQR